MILGMTKSEIGLVVFVFFLVYGAGFIGRFGAWIAGASPSKSGGQGES